MTSISSSNAVQSSFQQLSLEMAKRNAGQAEQQAQVLRKQADAARAEANKLESKARTLDAEANKAQSDSENARLTLNLSDAFQQTGKQLAHIITNASVADPSVNSSTKMSGLIKANGSDNAVGTKIDISA